MCEVFSANKCLGCSGMEADIDKVKKYCETYKEFMRGETNDKSRNTFKTTKS